MNSYLGPPLAAERWRVIIPVITEKTVALLRYCLSDLILTISAACSRNTLCAAQATSYLLPASEPDR